MMPVRHLWPVVLAILVVIALRGMAPASAADPEQLKRGAYLFNAAGCANCHTDRRHKGPMLGGGMALKTSFGTFYGPNISPDRTRGIGAWSDADFIRAMREGISPAGRQYYPAFPYEAFTLMTDRDLKDLKAYIFSLPPVARPSRPHELKFPFNIRAGVRLWKLLYFKMGPMVPRAGRSPQWNRGAYLAEAVVHCAECHTPRTALGGLRRTLWMAGNGDGPDGVRIPNITPDVKTGIGRWSRDDIIEALDTGLLPGGDDVGSLMADVVEYGTSKLTPADRLAIAVYLKALKPIEYGPPRKTKPRVENR